MTNVSIPEVNMLKNSSTLAASVPINLPINLGIDFVNGRREIYFVDASLIFNTPCMKWAGLSGGFDIDEA